MATFLLVLLGSGWHSCAGGDRTSHVILQPFLKVRLTTEGDLVGRGVLKGHVVGSLVIGVGDTVKNRGAILNGFSAHTGRAEETFGLCTQVIAVVSIA